MPNLNIGIPEILLAVVIGLFLWAGHRLTLDKRFTKYALVALVIVVGLLLYNWGTTFRAVN